MVLVFLGGGVGSVLRFGVGLGAARLGISPLPWATLFVNLVGCTIMGLLFRLLPAPEMGGASMRLLLMTGVLGGFTTFSAFSLDTALLWLERPDWLPISYVAMSIIGPLIGVWLGLTLGRLVA